jgi:hypothetical protein
MVYVDESVVVKMLSVLGVAGGLVCLVLVGEGLRTVEKGSTFEEPSCLQEPADCTAFDDASTSIAPSDWFILAYSFAGAIVIGIVCGREVQSAAKQGKGAQGFFLSGRHMPWYAVGASLFASNLGTQQFVGQAGAAANSGLAVGFFEWSACFILVLLGWFFAPLYLSMKVTTTPELFERRFDGRVRLVLFSIFPSAFFFFFLFFLPSFFLPSCLLACPPVFLACLPSVRPSVNLSLPALSSALPLFRPSFFPSVSLCLPSFLSSFRSIVFSFFPSALHFSFCASTRP